MTLRRRISLLSAAALHLVLVVFGGLGICLWEVEALGPLGPLFTYYSALTGADSGYGFYAPSVGDPPTITLTIVDDAGHAIADTLAPHLTREADIRVEDLIELFHHRRADDELRAQLAASWAATLFWRHPQARSVTIDMGFRRVPSLVDAARGKATRWRSVYRARVVRPARPDAGGAS
ncbi:hypothetical protein [Nannocystis punicea]|uniref:Uncharacterized protein n=1 Tax=Nannocystis punicea TaxID=2995304 RepID=A0ABY7GZM7_9BACT|nr:hypothetical protein [Nannocystis poenicansa]WAS92445.1 hypothetical protein O0S08_40215 [Nannocystis poenicansa]